MLRRGERYQWKHGHKYYYWVVNQVISFLFMIFKASLLIQITNINQLCIDHFV